MLILGTLVVTWIAHNWWKLLLLLIAIIVIHEYVVYKKHKNDPDTAGNETDSSEQTETENTEITDGEAAETTDSGDTDSDTEYIEYE